MKEYIHWFDSLKAKPLSYFFTPQDIAYINRLAMSPSMAVNSNEMNHILGELMKNRGFKLSGGGNNRRAYECTFEPGVVAKIAVNKIGMKNNLSDISSQNVLKPVCAKTFEVTRCGTMSIDEYVVPFKDISEYMMYAQEIFDILYFKLRNNDIAMDDIGTSRFKQWGLRQGFGPVILDYPTMYVADPNKRLCRSIHNGRICNGTIDYDDGFNNIVCSECGRNYKAVELKKPDGDNIDKLLCAVGFKKDEGVKKMSIKLVDHVTRQVIRESRTGGTSSFVDPSKSYKGEGNTSTVELPTPKRKKIGVRRVPHNEVVATTEEVKTTTTEEQQVPVIVDNFDSNVAKQVEVLNQFNTRNMLMTAGIVNENAKTADSVVLAKALSSSLVPENPYISREDAYDLYKQVSTATIYPFGADIKRIDTNNICHTSWTLVNTTLSNISGLPMTNDMFEVFYRLLLNVRNSKTFFMSVINFWYTLLEFCSFETDENPDGSVYCVYSDIMDIYYTAVKRAFEDFKYNIKLSGNFTYNASNVLNFIIKGVTELHFINENEMGDVDIDTTKFISIHTGKDYAEFTEVDITIFQKPEEYTQLSISEQVEEPVKEDVKEEEVSPAELYDKYVGTEPKKEPKKKATSRKKKVETIVEEEDDGKPKKKTSRKKKSES